MTLPIRLLAVVLLALGLAACRTELYSGLDQREANEIVAALARAGIDARREEVAAGSFRVTLAEADLPAAVDALARVGLPRQSFQSLGQIFPGDGLIVSPYEQRVRTMHALNQELAHTITTISGVLSARVHVVLPDLDLRGQPMSRPSASVVVQHAPGVDVEELGARIRMLVANAVQGLTFREVALAFFPAAAAEPIRPAASPAPVVAAAPAAGAAAPGPASIVLWLGALGLTCAGVVLWLRDRARNRRADEGGEA